MKKARCYYVKMTYRYSIYKADFIQKHLRMALIDAGPWASLQNKLQPMFFVIFHTSCFSIISKQHALQTTCDFLQLSFLNKRRGDKADNASFSMEALFHNPSGLASCELNPEGEARSAIAGGLNNRYESLPPVGTIP